MVRMLFLFFNVICSIYANIIAVDFWFIVHWHRCAMHNNFHVMIQVNEQINKRTLIFVSDSFSSIDLDYSTNIIIMQWKKVTTLLHLLKTHQTIHTELLRFKCTINNACFSVLVSLHWDLFIQFAFIYGQNEKVAWNDFDLFDFFMKAKAETPIEDLIKNYI